MGLYLSNVKDIYEIPDELDTKKFWGIVNVKSDYDEYDEEIEYPCDEYFKVAYKRRSISFNHMISLFEKPYNLLNEYFSNEQIEALQNSNRKLQNKMIQMGADLDQESLQVYYGYVNKKV